MKRYGSKKSTVYGVVTDQILQKFDEGVIPWANRFKISGCPHMNVTTKKPYNGINTISTTCKGYTSPFWISRKQAYDSGMKVKDGEDYTPIVFFTVVKDKKDPEKTFPITRYSQCFNVDQMEYIPDGKVPMLPEKIDENISAENLISKMEHVPEIKVAAYSKYSGADNTIYMKNQSAYKNPNDYYVDLFKQIILSTTNKTSLGQTIKPSEMELVAEIGSAFLCAECDIDFSVDDSTKYISYWNDKLSKSERLVIDASKKAYKAAEYVLKKHTEDAEKDYKKLLVDSKLRNL